MGITNRTLAPGSRFKTKWSGTPIVVEALLGEGANGMVYRVRTPLGRAAMKVCATSSDVALEWALLNSLGQGAGAFPKPMLIDDGPSEAPFFYIMEWIPGESLAKVLRDGDFSRAMRAFELIIDALVGLHQAGHAFCDLKPENVMVTSNRGQISIRFVDVGGVTRFGRSVRQYTPLCDRAFYDLGTRKAEPSYDLFGLVLGYITAPWEGHANELAKLHPTKRQKELQHGFQQFPVPAVSLLFDELTAGLIQSATELQQAWNALPASAKRVQVPAVRAKRRHLLHLWSRPHRGSKHRGSGKGSSGLKQGQRGSGQGQQPVQGSTGPHIHRRHKKAGATARHDWTEWVMWMSLGSAAVVCMVAWGMLLGWLP